jgi:hypothetical protein
MFRVLGSRKRSIRPQERVSVTASKTTWALNVALNFLLLLLLIRDKISHLSYLSIFGEYYTHLANEPIKVRTYI